MINNCNLYALPKTAALAERVYSPEEVRNFLLAVRRRSIHADGHMHFPAKECELPIGDCAFARSLVALAVVVQHLDQCVVHYTMFGRPNPHFPPLHEVEYPPRLLLGSARRAPGAG